MSITTSVLLNLHEYHSVMLRHTCSQIQAILDSEATEYPHVLTGTPTIHVDDGVIANTSINENQPQFGSAYEDSNLG